MNGWTAERRKRQAAAIHRWKPWERSTGPKTTEGKAIAARNAYSGATRPLLRDLARALREWSGYEPQPHSDISLLAGNLRGRRPGICYRETRLSLLQAGHLTNCGTSSSNHERPHSQRILYRCCTVTVPHSSSWTSIPLSVAVSGSATLGSTRGSCGKVPGSVVRSFTTKSLTALSVSHALVAFPTAAYLTRCATA